MTPSTSSPRFGLLQRTNSNPFLQKPLHISSESLPLLSPGQGFGSMLSMPSTSSALTPSPPSEDDDDQPTTNHPPKPQLQPPPIATHGHVARHLTLLDLIAVGVGGTLGTGIFVFCPLIASTYAGPSSVFCWLLSAVPALLSGLCFAELAGQIPAAGSTYAYVYASMGELPAVVAAGCLSLEYLVSASAVARGWGDKMVEWMADEAASSNSNDGDGGQHGGGTKDGLMARILQHPGGGGTSFNPMAFLLCAMVSMLLLCGVKESKAVTNYFTAVKVAVILTMILTGLGLLDVRNLRPFLPSEFGISGFFYGGTLSFMGYLGYDEVCCLTAEAIEPQRNMPRAILWTMSILTVCYMGATLALSGMLPYDQISAVGGFPESFEARGIEWASALASIGELFTLPLVVLVAIMAQPRLQFALACDGLMSPWFGRVDDEGNMQNGTLFAGSLMTLIASFVPLEYLNDLISAGVLVAFSMTNSSLLLLRHESPDDAPGLLEKLLTWFNALCFLSSLALAHLCTSLFGKMLTGLCCLLAFVACVLIHRWCPPAAYFGGKARRKTTQHMTVGTVAVSEEYFRTPLLPYVPCLGIFVNWYLVAQLTWRGLAFLAWFLSCAIFFYFSFGYYFSVGNNGGWDSFESCGLSIHSAHSQIEWIGDDDDDGDDDERYIIVPTAIDEEDAEHDDRSTDNDSSAPGLPIGM